MPKLSGRSRVLSVVIVAAYCYYVYVIASSLRDETDTTASEARMYDWIMRASYRVAEYCGNLGLRAELKRNSVLEQGRMN